MARDKQAQASVPASAPAPDINALRAQRKAISEQLKALKAQSDGKIAAVDVSEPDANTGRRTILFDVEEGDGSRRTEDGKKAYAFSCDPFEFKHPNGKTYRTSAFYALEVLPKA